MEMHWNEFRETAKAMKRLRFMKKKKEVLEIT